MRSSPDDAVLLHILRVHNITDPAGRLVGKLLIPDPLYEERECCAGISRDTRAPLTAKEHCRTLQHVCALLEVDLELAWIALQEEHWRILRKLLLLAHQEPYFIGSQAIPTVREYAPIIVQYASKFAHEFSTDELKTIARWISRYYPEAANIDWDAVCVLNQLQEW